MKPVLVIEDDTPVDPKATLEQRLQRKPIVELRWKDLTAKQSAVREEAIKHYGIQVGPWGIIAAVLFGLMIAGILSGIRDFDWTTPWTSTIGLAFTVFFAWLFLIITLRSMPTKKQEKKQENKSEPSVEG